jgi:hypothetical protein
MPATATPVYTSNKTPARSVKGCGLSPEKYEAMSALPTENAAVDVRKSTPTSAAVPRCACRLPYRPTGALPANLPLLGALAVFIFVPFIDRELTT